MTNTKNSKNMKTTHFAARPAHCTAPAQYAMRAECQLDCLQMRAVLGIWVAMWREDRCYIEGSDGVPLALPDVDVVFSMTADAPSIEEIRWLLDCLVDCHVAAESLCAFSDYTGERADHLEMLDLMRRPSNEVISEARGCIRRTKTCLRNDFGRLNDAAGRLESELGCDIVKLEQRAHQFANKMKTSGRNKGYRHDEATALKFGRQFAKTEWLQTLG